jgi:hypothetical protein
MPRSQRQHPRLPFGRRASQATAWLVATVWFAAGCAPQRATADEPTPAAAVAPTLDAALARFAPTGTVARASARGDLDGDGDEDALLVVEREGADAATSPRALLLLRRDAKGTLQAAVTGTNAILCLKCGGMMGDPLQGMRVGRGEFTLRFEGGSRELWSSEFRFAYARDRDTWRLTGIAHGGFDRADGKAAERRLTAADFGDVPLASFDPHDYPADALP